MIKSRGKLAILINPPIYDTQYWARWSMPHGLLKIATWLRNEGYDLKLFDCLNPYSEYSGVPERVADFESYDAVRKQKKSVVVLASTEERDEPLTYKLKPNEKWKYIFGMSLHELEDQLINLKKSTARKKYKSVEFWITSIMTYWWESTRDVVQLALRVFPDAKIRLGGIYPTLAPWHAESRLGINPLVMKGDQLNLNNDGLMERHLVIFNEVPEASNLDLATDLYDENERPPYTILTTSRGCPHICAYCASNILNDGTKVRTRSFEDVIAEIKDKFRKNTRVFCFYEDNLLMKMQEFKRILKAVLADKSLQGIKIYAPEGIEIGVALSDRKRYLLKMKSDKSILATLSLDTSIDEMEPDTADIYDAYKQTHEKVGEKKITIKFEEDLTQGAVVVNEVSDDRIVLVIGDEDKVILKKIIKENGRADLIFENQEQSSLGLYLSAVPEIIYLMRLAGFEKIYLPLETIKKETNARWNRSWNSNLSRFETLLAALEEVGFDTRKQNINAFVMFGLPGEDLEEILDTALYASERVGSVIPMLFTPVPSTNVYEQYRSYIEEHGYDLHHLNGKLFPFFPMLRDQMRMKHPEYDIEISDYVRVESFMQRINSKINGKSVNIYADTRVSSTFRKVYSEYESLTSAMC
jgi:hypothetical protein